MKMSYQEKVRQSTQENFTASKFAIKKALLLLCLVVIIGITIALMPKIKTKIRSYTVNKINTTTEETRKQMSPLEAQFENLINSMGF